MAAAIRLQASLAGDRWRAASTQLTAAKAMARKIETFPTICEPPEVRPADTTRAVVRMMATAQIEPSTFTGAGNVVCTMSETARGSPACIGLNLRIEPRAHWY